MGCDPGPRRTSTPSPSPSTNASAASTRSSARAPAATARAIGEPIAPLSAVRPELPEAMTDAIDAALDPDPELRPLASELEAALAAHVNELDGAPLPAVEGLRGVRRRRRAAQTRRCPSVARFLPGVGVAALGLAALIATGAPAPIALAALVPGVLALGRPRPAYALQLALVVLWTLIGAGEPGVAALIVVLGAPLLAAGDRSRCDPPSGRGAHPRA